MLENQTHRYAPRTVERGEIGLSTSRRVVELVLSLRRFHDQRGPTTSNAEKHEKKREKFELEKRRDTAKRDE